MGFATRNCENYIGYAELAGADPEKYLATICHVDVVPVGNGWTADPFKMRIQDGWLLGRGVSDDKGPMIVTLYALKFLKEQGAKEVICAISLPFFSGDAIEHFEDAYRQGWFTRIIGTNAVFFFLLNVFKVPFMCELGLIDFASVKANLLLAVFVWGGAFAGRHILARMPQRLFENVALVLAVAAGVKLLL
jgi:hypothetical protein